MGLVGPEQRTVYFSRSHLTIRPAQATPASERIQETLADPPGATPSQGSSPVESEAPRSASQRIAIFSDVHGNLAGLRAVAAALERVKALDHVVVAGDLLQGGPRPAEV